MVASSTAKYQNPNSTQKITATTISSIISGTMLKTRKRSRKSIALMPRSTIRLSAPVRREM